VCRRAGADDGFADGAPVVTGASIGDCGGSTVLPV